MLRIYAIQVRYVEIIRISSNIPVQFANVDTVDETNSGSTSSEVLDISSQQTETRVSI